MRHPKFSHQLVVLTSGGRIYADLKGYTLVIRTWPVVGSLEKARKIGWTEEYDIDTFSQGYVPVFEELKRYRVG